MQLSEADSVRDLRPPRLNGRYVVTRLLGKGAQARVYLAMDARLRQWRAVKVLAPDLAADELVRQRFEKEAEAMARLSHKNLLRILDIDADGELPFIVMELARAGAVTDWLKRHGVMSPHLAVDVIAQACDGLAHAHAQGVVHRDVKPHNLLVSDDGRVLLTDFGIAQLGSDESMTQTGSVLGTFAYMAPEQRNDTKSVDARTDVYALGATLYTCLTLRTSAELFFAENRDEILDGIPEELALAILDACRYDRDDRIGSVTLLKERLEACLPHLTEVESPPLNSQVMPVPERPPRILPPDSGVGELAQLLGSKPLDVEAHLPRNRAEMLFEEQSTTLYSDTGYEEEDSDFAFADEGGPADEQEDPGVTQPSEIPDAAWARRNADEHTDPSGGRPEPSGGYDQTTQTHGFRRTSFDSQPIRRPLAELSEEDGPSYVDVSTLDGPSPAIDDGRSSRSGPLAVIPGRDAKRSPVTAPALHTAEPASRRQHRDRKAKDDRPPLLLYAATALMFVVTMLASWSVLEKATTSYAAQESWDILQLSIAENRDALIDAVPEQRRELTDMWFAVREAPASHKRQQMETFAIALVDRASSRELTPLAHAHLQRLRAAVHERAYAKRAADEARASWLGRLTGPLGVFRY